jgi:hypothetical protein
MRQRPSVTSLSRSNVAASDTVRKTSGLTCRAARPGLGRGSVALTLGLRVPSVSLKRGRIRRPAWRAGEASYRRAPAALRAPRRCRTGRP